MTEFKSIWNRIVIKENILDSYWHFIWSRDSDKVRIIAWVQDSKIKASCLDRRSGSSCCSLYFHCIIFVSLSTYRQISDFMERENSSSRIEAIDTCSQINPILVFYSERVYNFTEWRIHCESWYFIRKLRVCDRIILV